MEQLQIENISLNTSIDSIQQLELIQKYNRDKSQHFEQINFYLLRTFFVFFLILIVFCFFVHYVSAKFHLWPSSGDLP